MIPGCYDPGGRVDDMDLDGVQVTMPFPSLPRFAGTLFLEGEAKELARLCVSAWNDFLLDEWCVAAPHRFIPLTRLPLWDSKVVHEHILEVPDRTCTASSS